MSSTEGLRERKKQRTRETIVREALPLFRERGYDATTIADIAAAADIAPRTFFGYFPSKEAVLFGEADADFESFRAALEERPDGVTTMEAMREWIAAKFSTGDLEETREQKRRRCIEESPEL